MIIFARPPRKGDKKIDRYGTVLILMTKGNSGAVINIIICIKLGEIWWVTAVIISFRGHLQEF